MVHYTAQANKQLPPLHMTRAHAPRKHLCAPLPATKVMVSKVPAASPPTVKPTLVRRSSSMCNVARTLSQQVEVRFRNLREAFRAADRNGSGGLSRDELQAALFHWRVPAQARHLEAIMADFDRDGDNSISYSEFCDGLKPFCVVSQPIFGLDDRHVTDRHCVLPSRVLINDNLTLTPSMGARCDGYRPDYQVFELPRDPRPASPSSLEMHKTMLSNRIHDKFKKLRDAFRSFDENKDGKLSEQEILAVVRDFNLPIPREHVMQLARRCDANSAGLINYNEFAMLLKRKDALGR